MVSHVKSKSGSTQGSTGEGAGELAPITPPVWDIVPDGSAQQGTIYQIPMTTWVKGRGLENWALIGNPTGVTIDSLGVVTILDTVPAQVLSMSCYVENEAGNDTSNTFEWELEAGHIPEPPVWDIVPPQSTPDSQLPDQLDMKDYVTSFLPITDWTTTEGSITADGILVIPQGTPVGTLSITVTAENDDGVSPSAPFDWEITLSGDEPEWDTVPDLQFLDTDLPDSVDMNDYILLGAGLTGWALSGNPAGITIDGAGLVTIAGGTDLGDHSMTCYVENSFGSANSNTFIWTVYEELPPIWDEIPEQVNDDRDHPVDLNLVPFVTSNTPLTDWTTDVGSVDGVGLLTVPFTALGTQDITVGVTNNGGTEQTTFEWTTVRTAADIDTQPVPLIVDEPNGGEFTVEVSHPNTNVFDYLWQADIGNGWQPAHTELSDVENGTQSTDTLVLQSTLDEDNGVVRCRIRSYSGAGGEQVFTDAVALTVNPLGPPIWDEIPDDEVNIGDMPYERDMSAFVNSDPLVPITDYTTDIGSITSAGLLTVQDSEGLGTHTITVFAVNERGTVPGSFGLNIIDESFEGYHHDFNADLGGFTFTRASSAWGLAEDGIFYESTDHEPVYPGCGNDGNGNWIPNIGFKGLLLEGAGVNELLDPADITTGNWNNTNTSSVGNAIASVIHGEMADRLVENTNDAQHHISQDSDWLVDDIPVSYTVLILPDERDWTRILLKANGGGVNRNCDVDIPNKIFDTETHDGPQYIDDLDSGWKQIATGYTTSGSGNPQNGVSNTQLHDGISSAYEGDGVSGFYIAATQLEVFPFQTSLMLDGPRAFNYCEQDLIGMVGQNLTNNFAIRLIFELIADRALYNLSNNEVMAIHAGSTNEQIQVRFTGTNPDTLTVLKRIAGGVDSQINIPMGTPLRGEAVDIIVVQSDTEGMSLYLNGELADNVPAATGTFPVPLHTIVLGTALGTGTSSQNWLIVKSLTIAVGEGSDKVPPSITEQPEPLTVTEPAGGQFDIVAAHPTGPLFYWWQINDGASNWTRADSIDEITTGAIESDTLVLNYSDDANDARRFRCRVRAENNNDELETFSDEALLTVISDPNVPPTIDTQPQDLTLEEPNGGEFTVEASHPTGPLFYAWQIERGGGWLNWDSNMSDASGQATDTAVINTSLEADSGTVRCRVRAVVNDNTNQVYTNEVDLSVLAADSPPDWHTPIPNQVTEVLDMPATFNANSYVDSEDTISAWSTIQGASSVNGSGVVSLPRRGVGSLNNDAVRATNSSGTTQSDNFNWTINPSEVLDEEFDYSNGALEGNGPWLVLDRGDAESHTVVGGGGRINSGPIYCLDATDSIPTGDYECFATLAENYNQIIPGLEDQQIFGVGLIEGEQLSDGTFINTLFDSVVWLDSVSGNLFTLNVAPSANDTYGIRRIGNNVECIKNGSVEGTLTAGTPLADMAVVLASFPLGNTQTVGFFDVTFTVIG